MKSKKAFVVALIGAAALMLYLTNKSFRKLVDEIIRKELKNYAEKEERA